MSCNLARLPSAERISLELDKQAAYQVWQVKAGRMSREQVRRSLEALPVEHREYFRCRLNHYRQC